MKALLVFSGYFPTGSAYSARAANLARILYSAGCDVHIIAAYSKERAIDCGAVYNLENLTYQITDLIDRGSLDSFVGAKHFYSEVKKYICENHVDIVQISGGLTYYSKLSRLCRKHQIKYIIEQCEWYDISNFKFRIFDPRYWRATYLINGGYRHVDGVIATSKLLERHYKEMGLKTIRVPSILDVEELKHNETCIAKDKLNIIYTGTSGKSKELFRPIFEVLNENEELKKKVHFDIYGPNEKLVEQNVGSKELMNGVKDCVCVHGMVDQKKMNEIQSQADFQFFMRPDRRSSHAGFPTKLGESMAAGTPVITNNTSDIACYVENGVNGYIVNDSNELKNVLMSILNQTSEERADMRRNARETAVKYFNYKAYINDFEKFMNSVYEGRC